MLTLQLGPGFVRVQKLGIFKIKNLLYSPSAVLAVLVTASAIAADAAVALPQTPSGH